jgi:N-6 DNA Methylase
LGCKKVKEKIVPFNGNSRPVRVITESGDTTMSSLSGSQAAVSAAALKPFLESFGYVRTLLQPHFPLGDGQTVPLVAFAHPPADARTACIAVINADHGTAEIVAQCRPLAAPVVFVCGRPGLEWWQQASEVPVRNGLPIPPDGLVDFFAAHRAEFAPDAIYRAKTWGRFDTQYQRGFVDLGLMPFVEGRIGRELTTLISRDVQKLKSLMGWATLSAKQGQWLLKSVFWVVSAKILRDKDVGRFGKLDPLDVESLLDAVAEHFDAERIPTKSERQREALTEIAADVNGFSNLRLATTESLAYVYENTLISEATRQRLGTHSTPPYLVDYIVGKLAPWINEIPLESRNVFEPACGHGAFLVSAMRLLTELLPKGKFSAAQRRSYLRSRIHGCDTDDFALEIARLSLSLTDIPNPDGWDLIVGDMFEGDALEIKARTATILLANPPFENFGAESRSWYGKRRVELRHYNKTTELLARVLPTLPDGAVLGVIVPQGFLHNKNASSVRRVLTSDFELKEICQFPDKVFTFSDMESAVLIARKKEAHGVRSNTVRYRRIREREMESFRREYRVSSESMIESSLFDNESSDLRVPDLREVWDYCRKSMAAKIEDVAEIGKGLEYKSRGISSGMVTYSKHEFPNAVRGYVRFERNLQIHELPREFWMNLDSSVVQAPRHGTRLGIPQTLLNYARVSRGPWRVKALMDSVGRPVTTRFLVVRSVEPREIAPDFFWALFNSPVANAFAFVVSGKRDNLSGLLGELPVPELSTTTVQYVVAAARNYRNYVHRDPNAVLLHPIDTQKARELLLRVDFEVLRMYALPRELEWQLLNLFAGWPRKGVPFKFDRYFPEHLTDRITLADYLAITADWPGTNHRRDALIRKKVARTISAEERTELGHLQSLASLRVRLLAPLPLGELEQAHRSIVGNSPE